MTCWDGFGNLADKRPFWTGKFMGGPAADILFYYPGDKNWWLGRFAGNQLQWSLCGNTAGFGQVGDGRPIWSGDFAGAGRTDLLFYYPGDKNWWLGQFDSAGKLNWTLAGNTAGFGQVWDGRPFFLGDFTGDGKQDILFYYPGDKNWWLGRFVGNQLQWTLAGNTAGFGQVWDGRPFWAGDFAGTGRNDLLFYYPGDKNWWLAQFDANGKMSWNLAGNTAGFGQVWDGRPFWTGDFTGDGKKDILFYYPGDKNWWLGRFNGNQLQWNLAGNTAGFGQVGDGRPIWAGDFAGTGRSDILFYFPGDRNWWLGQFDTAGKLSWNLAGNTSGFGQVWDGRPFYIDDFSGDGKADVLFYYPGDGNWWLGRFSGSQLQWNLAGNTGRPYQQRVVLHLKVLTTPNVAINTMVENMRTVYRTAGIRVDVNSNETLSLPALNDLDVGGCTSGEVTAETSQLYGNRNNVGQNELAVYFVRSTNGTSGPLNGCAAHPSGRPGCVVTQIASQWTLAHEVGHVLGLNHLAGENCSAPGYVPTQLMTGCGTSRIVGTPTLSASAIATMLNSPFSIPC